MSDASTPLTDPARELAELFTLLKSGRVDLPGDKYLADRFGVEAWSQDFYRIIATIMDRLEELKAVIGTLELDDDFLAEMLSHVDQAALAFSPSGYQNQWQGYGA